MKIGTKDWLLRPGVYVVVRTRAWVWQDVLQNAVISGCIFFLSDLRGVQGCNTLLTFKSCATKCVLLGSYPCFMSSGFSQVLWWALRNANRNESCSTGSWAELFIHLLAEQDCFICQRALSIQYPLRTSGRWNLVNSAYKDLWKISIDPNRTHANTILLKL